MEENNIKEEVLQSGADQREDSSEEVNKNITTSELDGVALGDHGCKLDTRTLRCIADQCLNECLHSSDSYYRERARIVVLCDILLGHRSARPRAQLRQCHMKIIDFLEREDGYGSFLQSIHNKEMHARNGNQDTNPDDDAVGDVAITGVGTTGGTRSIVTSQRGLDLSKDINPESPLLTMLSRIGMPDPGRERNGTFVGSWGSKEHAVANWISVNQTHENLHVHDAEFRVHIVAGSHWYTRQWWVQNGVHVPRVYPFGVRLVQGVGAGAAVEPRFTYSNAMKITRGEVVGDASRALRVNLSGVVGNIDFIHAGIVGADVTSEHGVSTAGVLLRCLLHLGSCSPFNMGSDTKIANEGFRPSFPFSTAKASNTMWWNWSAMRVNNLVDNMVQAMITDMGTYTRVADGLETPVAGWGSDNWTKEGVGGVVTVPIRQGWDSEATLNIHWAGMHSDWPPVINMIRGDLIERNGNRGTGGSNGGWSMPSYVHVPGAARKILFVCTDLHMQANSGVAVKGGNLAPTWINANVNSLVGGQPVNIGNHWRAYWPGNCDIQLENSYQCVQRWAEIGANQADWDVAWYVAADVYARWDLGPRRISDGGEMLFLSRDQDAARTIPFPVRDLGYNGPTSTDVDNLLKVETSASGLLPWRGDVIHPVTSADYIVPMSGPLVYMGLAGFMYKVVDRSLRTGILVGAHELAHRLSRDNTILACGFDYLCQSSGVSEEMVMNPTGQPILGDAKKWFDDCVLTWKNFLQGGVARLAFPTWQNNRIPNDAYQTLCELSRATAGLNRVPTQLFERYGLGEGFVMRNDYLDLRKEVFFPWVAKSMNVGGHQGIWEIADYDTSDLVLDKDKGNKLRHALCVGTFTPAATNIQNIALSDMAGAYTRMMSLQFSHPTNGYMWSTQYDNFHISRNKGDIHEVMRCAIPRTIDPSLGNRKMRLAIMEGQEVTRTKGRIGGLPFQVTRSQYGDITGTPLLDSQSADIEDVRRGIFHL